MYVAIDIRVISKLVDDNDTASNPVRLNLASVGDLDDSRRQILIFKCAYHVPAYYTPSRAGSCAYPRTCEYLGQLLSVHLFANFCVCPGLLPGKRSMLNAC